MASRIRPDGVAMPDRTKPDEAALTCRFAEVVGPDRVTPGSELTIQGVRPSVTVEPADEQQLIRVLAAASSDGLAVCVAGGGTKLDWGNPPARCDVLVSTLGLTGECRIDADDLTATMAAGVTISEARARAAAKNRVLPLDGVLPHRATVGGVAATGDQGARGAAYGGVRDLALGLRAVLADGTPVRFGGRTMKNVAGYDMTKLFVGSFGVLGVITEVTFRLLPQPDTQALLIVPLNMLAEGKVINAQIIDSRLQPLVLEFISAELVESVGSGLSAVSPDGASGLLLVGFAGHRAAVERSISEIRGYSHVRCPALLTGAEAGAILEALTGLGGDPAGNMPGLGGAALKVRVTLPVSALWAAAEMAESLSRAQGCSVAYRMGAARGILDLWVGPRKAAAPDLAAPTAVVAGVRKAVVASGGRLSVIDGLELLSPGFDAWGDPGPAVEVMRRIKERFDPRCVLNAHRFVGGI